MGRPGVRGTGESQLLPPWGCQGVRPAGSLQPGVPSAQRTPTTSARRGGCGPAHLSHCQALRRGTRLQDGEASLPARQHLRRDACAAGGLGRSGRRPLPTARSRAPTCSGQEPDRGQPAAARPVPDLWVPELQHRFLATDGSPHASF